MTIQQIDKRIKELKLLIDRGRHHGEYQQQGCAVALCMPVIEELRKLIDDENNWKPIETAPKDGRDIIVGRAGCNNLAVYFYEEYQEWHPGSQKSLEYYPTHWKSMPEPISMTNSTTETSNSLIDIMLAE